MGGQWDTSWDGTSPSFVAPQMTLPPPTVYAMAPPIPVSFTATVVRRGSREAKKEGEGATAAAIRAARSAAGAAGGTARGGQRPDKTKGKKEGEKEGENKPAPWDVPAPALTVTTPPVKTSGAVVVGVAAETEQRGLKDMATDEIGMLSLDAAEKLLAVEEEKAAAAAVKAKRVAAMKVNKAAAMRAKEAAAVKAKEVAAVKAKEAAAVKAKEEAKGAAAVKGALKKAGGTDKATAAAPPSRRGSIPEELLCPISGKVRGRTMNNERMNG